MLSQRLLPSSRVQTKAPHTASSSKQTTGLEWCRGRTTTREPFPGGKSHSSSGSKRKLCLRSHDSGRSVKPMPFSITALTSRCVIRIWQWSLECEEILKPSTDLTTHEKEDSSKVCQEINLTVELLDGTDEIEIPRL